MTMTHQIMDNQIMDNQIMSETKIGFSLFAPYVESVELVGSWLEHSLVLKREDSGHWRLETALPDGVEPFAYHADGWAEGCRMPGVMGTYLHGAFEDAGVVNELLGLKIETTSKSVMYDRLADWLVQYSRPDVLEALLA